MATDTSQGSGVVPLHSSDSESAGFHPSLDAAQLLRVYEYVYVCVYIHRCSMSLVLLVSNTLLTGLLWLP